MNGMRAANCFRAGFGQSKVPDFALADELRHRADGIFNLRLRIDAMLIVKIDAIDLQPAQTFFARFLHVIRFAVNAEELLLHRIAQNSKLRRNDNFVAMSFEQTTDQLLIGMRTVDVGGVEKSDA